MFARRAAGVNVLIRRSDAGSSWTVHRRLDDVDAGVTDQMVEAAELVDRMLDQPACDDGVTDVSGRSRDSRGGVDTGMAFSPQNVHGFGGLRRVVAVDQHRGALPQQRACDAETDATARSGDNCGRAGQVEEVSHHTRLNSINGPARPVSASEAELLGHATTVCWY
jgi:hypothetical protein